MTKSKEEYLNVDVSSGGEGTTTKKKHILHIKSKMFYFIVVVIILVAGVFVYRYIKSPTYQAQKISRENKSLVEKVRGLMILPDEEPVIFIVDDPEVLVKQQLFFTGVQKDDRLLIFLKNGKAVVYSPSRNVIVNVGPINFPAK